MFSRLQSFSEIAHRSRRVAQKEVRPAKTVVPASIVRILRKRLLKIVLCSRGIALHAGDSKINKRAFDSGSPSLAGCHARNFVLFRNSAIGSGLTPGWRLLPQSCSIPLRLQ